MGSQNAAYDAINWAVCADIGLRTRTKVWRDEHGTRYRGTVTYGFDLAFARKHNQAPYFTITTDVDRWERGRWVEDSGGQQHDLVRAMWPELAPYTKWHLVSPEGPMHYLPNASYWYELVHGRSKWEVDSSQDPVAAFKSTVIYGAVDGDEHFDPSIPPAEHLHDQTVYLILKWWLEQRREALMARFKAELRLMAGQLPSVELEEGS